VTGDLADVSSLNRFFVARVSLHIRVTIFRDRGGKFRDRGGEFGDRGGEFNNSFSDPNISDAI
jgi:hypothetical protein